MHIYSNFTLGFRICCAGRTMFSLMNKFRILELSYFYVVIYFMFKQDQLQSNKL